MKQHLFSKPMCVWGCHCLRIGVLCSALWVLLFRIVGCKASSPGRISPELACRVGQNRIYTPYIVYDRMSLSY